MFFNNIKDKTQQNEKVVDIVDFEDDDNDEPEQDS